MNDRIKELQEAIDKRKQQDRANGYEVEYEIREYPGGHYIQMILPGKKMD